MRDAGRLVSIRTNGTGFLEIRVEPVFFVGLGSEATSFGFVVSLAGGQGRSSSVSASLRDQSTKKAEAGRLPKMDGARGRGGGNSLSISSRLSSSVFREAKESGCRLGVDDPKSSGRGSPLELSGVCDKSGEEGRENEEEGPGDDDGGGGEGIEAGTSGLGVRQTRYSHWISSRSESRIANSSSDSVSGAGLWSGRGFARALSGVLLAGAVVRLAGVERGGKMLNSSSEESSPPSSSRRIASALRNVRKSSASEELVAGLRGASLVI